MYVEIVVFLALVFVVATVLLWRSRRGGTGDPVVPPASDRPEPAISSESMIGPHRNLGRPFHVEGRDRPTNGGNVDPGD
jgi:hypothetical protein